MYRFELVEGRFFTKYLSRMMEMCNWKACCYEGLSLSCGVQFVSTRSAFSCGSAVRLLVVVIVAFCVVVVRFLRWRLQFNFL